MAALAFVCAAPGFAAEKVLKVGTGFLSSNRGNPYQGITLPPVFPHHAVYDTLTTLDRDGKVAPSLAVSWQAETPSVWVFKLRPGVAFTNGEMLTSEALVASAEHMATAKGRSETIGSQMYQVARAEAVDELTVRVHLSEPDGLFPLHASSWRIPAPKAYANTPREEYDAHPVGSGPFKVVSWDAGKVVMVANRQSWRAPKLDGIEIVEVADETARLQAFLSGAVNFVMGVAPDNRPQIEQDGGVMFTRMTLLVHFLAFNTTRETPLKDKRVRQALNLAVDRAAIVREVLGGMTEPASQLSYKGAFGYNDALKPMPYDPDKAKKLLAEAGYPNGLKLVVGVTAGLRASDTLYAQQIAADLAKIGVSAEVLSRPQQKQQADMFNGKLDVDIHSTFTRGVDAITDYRHRTCAGLTQGRAAYHCDPAITTVVKAAMAESDADQRAALYRQVAAMEQDSPPGILLWRGAEFDALKKNITGYRPAYDLLNLHDVDIKN